MTAAADTLADRIRPHVNAGRSGVSTPDRPPRRAGRVRRTLLVLAVMFVVTGLTLFGGTVLAPQFVDKVTGDAGVAIDKAIHGIVAPGALPEIRLGVEGGMSELDRCDGTFTEMVSYRVDDVLPLYAAHNICGGGIILGWPIGQHIRVAGSDVVYEVVEERFTPKWSHVDVLKGMSGEFMLQTCVFGENRMRILGLAPVGGAEASDE
jgi:hypothetical protein